jgi:hypothetical protein
LLDPNTTATKRGRLDGWKEPKLPDGRQGELMAKRETRQPSVSTVHIVEGQPWKDALISVLEPRSPYRPW